MNKPRTININLRQFFYMFDTDEQWINLYDTANDGKLLFNGQINEVPEEFYDRRVILLETQTEIEFDGCLGIWIATENEDEYYDEYNEEEEEEE